VDSSQRGQIVSVDKVAGLHVRADKMAAQHLPKGVAGQPGKESRRYAEASQANRNVEARSTWMRLIREVPTNRGRRCQIDECVARHYDRRVGRHAENLAAVSHENHIPPSTTIDCPVM
jgi:hypothetical protein